MSLDLNQFQNAKCSARNCGAKAAVLPALLLYADKNTKPAKLKLAHPICKKCAQGTTVAMILTPALWLQVNQAINEMKLPPPVKALTELAFVVIPQKTDFQQRRK